MVDTLLEAMAMRARDIMSRPVYTVRTTDTIEYAAALLAARKITAAPVLDPAGRLVGMISEGDLLRHRVPADPTAHMRRIAGDGAGRPHLVVEVMTARPVTAWPEADLADLAELMLRHEVRSIPLLDDDERIVGIVSRRDILRTVIRTDDVLCHEVQQRLDEYAGTGVRRWTAAVRDGTATIDGDLSDESEATVVSAIVRSVPGIAAVRVAQPAAG